jgi:hypothetical protein
MKEYVVYKRLKGRALGGDMNLPYGTKLICNDEGLIHLEDGRQVCYDHSQMAYDHMARDDDGCGIERGLLVDKIKKSLCNNQSKWDKIWADTKLERFKRPEHTDHWLWNYDFYNAHIYDLEYIYNKIK